jgi:translation initiation factor 1 (eIF-1/SUI1)
MTTDTHTMQDAAEDAQSKVRIDIQNKTSLKEWAKALGTTTEALETAVIQVGPRVDKIKDYLTAGMAEHQEGG